MQLKFADLEIMSTFAIPNEKNGTRYFKGSIAQLVESICLTSRGSGVRLPLLPLKKPYSICCKAFFFVCLSIAKQEPLAMLKALTLFRVFLCFRDAALDLGDTFTVAWVGTEEITGITSPF